MRAGRRQQKRRISAGRRLELTTPETHATRDHRRPAHVAHAEPRRARWEECGDGDVEIFKDYEGFRRVYDVLLMANQEMVLDGNGNELMCDVAGRV